jgi:ribulose-phosphate 3-epimerase
MKKRSELLPAILVKSRKEGIARLKKASTAAKKVQIDIIDGKFAKNKTIMPKSFSGLKNKLKYEWQLMVKEPEKLLHDIVAIPQSHLVIIHVESFKKDRDLFAMIEHIKFHNLKVGIALNPKTPASKIKPYLDKVDQVLVMTVNPGFMNQKWINMSKKIRQIQKWSSSIDIEVDGGIHEGTALKCREAGANLFVSGSALYNAKNFKQAYNQLKKEVR